MGFAEQLAAKVAEANSHREKSANGDNAGSVGSGRTKVRRPRIRPIDDDGYGDEAGVRAVDHFVEGGHWNAARKSSTSSSSSFAEQLKQRASRGQVQALDASTNNGRPAPAFTQDSNNDALVNASDTNVTHNQSIVLDGRDQPVDSPRQSGNTREEDPFTMHSSPPVQMQRDHSNERSLVSPSLYNGNRSRADSRDQLQRKEVSPEIIQPTLRHVDSPHQQLQKHPPKHDPCDTADTTAIFGAWAQIEQLQRRLKEAELRAEREMRRAELAEQRGHATLAPARNLGGADSKVDKTLGNQSYDNKGVQINSAFTHKRKSSSDKPSTIADAERTNSPAYQEAESEESLETVALTPDQCLPVSSTPMKSYETPPKNNQTANSTANDELLEWKKRALEAEARLMKQDYSILVSPRSSSATTRPPPPTQQPPSSAVESELIQLKNAEIEVLRSQISRLELRIKEECQRSSEILQAYLPHRDSPRPPLVVAEYTSSIAGESLHEYEFRMLREEIRHLQYQLSQKNRNANTSAQSTTGSTLSSLENENEEEEHEQGAGAKSYSSWGLCCVRRSKRGYGRVSR